MSAINEALAKRPADAAPAPEPTPRAGQESLFCATLVNCQWAWDATSLSMFKDCPRKYYYAIIKGYRPVTVAAPLAFGGYLHAALETWDRNRVKGQDHETSVRNAVRWLLAETVTYGVEYEETQRGFDVATGTETETKFKVFIADDDGPALAALTDEQRARCTRTHRPWHTSDPNRTRETLLRSFIWYTEQFRDDNLKTAILPDGKPALELSFRIELPLTSPDGKPYFWCGHIDKIAEMLSDFFIQERKHTKSTLGGYYFDKYSPSTQVTGYTFAGQIVLSKPVRGAIIDAVQVAQSFSRPGRSLQTRTRAQLDEWLRGQLYWIKQAEECARAEYWPLNEESCSKFGGCQFRGICSKDPSIREMFLNNDFQVRHWNPLEVREGDN
jgi:hypothetical protein